jgi:hypothetical protein
VKQHRRSGAIGAIAMRDDRPNGLQILALHPCYVPDAGSKSLP